jgi:hypothetical protein
VAGRTLKSNGAAVSDVFPAGLERSLQRSGNTLDAHHCVHLGEFDQHVKCRCRGDGEVPAFECLKYDCLCTIQKRALKMDVRWCQTCFGYLSRDEQPV